MNKPTLCGSNRINIPESGCGDCEHLEYLIEQIQEWIENFEEEGYDALANKPTINGVTVEGDKTSEEYLITPISVADIIELTPMECYEPPCQDSRACFGEACCMIVACNTNPNPVVCEGGVCYAEVSCEPEPPTPTPEASMNASIYVEEQESYAEGDELSVIYTVVNNGELDITNATVTATKTNDTWTLTELLVNSSFEEERSYILTAEDIANGYVTFDLSAVGTANGESVNASATVTLNLTDEPTPRGVFDLSIDATVEGMGIGDRIEVGYTVANSGDATITSITATALKTSNVYTIASLSANGSQQFVAYYTLTAEDVAEGSVTFTLSASGTTNGETITESITEVITLAEDESE